MEKNPYKVAGLLDYQVEAQLKNLPNGGQGKSARDWFDHPELTSYVHDTILGPIKGSTSVALIDWTTLYHVAALFEGELDQVDPFVALADLSSMVAAALFYDRIVVLNGEPHLAVVKQALNLGESLVSLRTDAVVEKDGYPLLEAQLDSSFQKAAISLARTPKGHVLLDSLDRSWQEMIPGIQVPSRRNIQDVAWEFSGDRPDHLRQLFHPDPSLSGMWAFQISESLITKSDVAALSYENLAATLSSAISAQPGPGPTVRYVGGVLRAPMQRAVRAAWHAAWDEKGPPAEAALNGWWQERFQKRPVTPAFPFWISAILENCDNRDDFGRQVSTWRRRAAHFRAARVALEQALIDDNPTAYDNHQRALGGAIDELGESQIIGGAVAAGQATLALTGIPPVAVNAATALLDKEVEHLIKPTTKWLLRATRPRLWFLATMNDAAQQLLRPQVRLRKVFALPAADNREPEEFLRRVNRVEWAL